MPAASKYLFTLNFYIIIIFGAKGWKRLTNIGEISPKAQIFRCLRQTNIIIDVKLWWYYYFSMLKPEKINKHRGNFAEGAKFLVFQCMQQAFLTLIMLFMILLLYNIKDNFAEGEKIWGGYFAEGEKFLDFPGTEQKSPAWWGGGPPSWKPNFLRQIFKFLSFLSPMVGPIGRLEHPWSDQRLISENGGYPVWWGGRGVSRGASGTV